jgi:hypothetical protein
MDLRWETEPLRVSPFLEEQELDRPALMWGLVEPMILSLDIIAVSGTVRPWTCYGEEPVMDRFEIELVSRAMNLLEEIEPWNQEITDAHGILAAMYYRELAQLGKEFANA